MGRNSRRLTGIAVLAGALLATPAAAQTDAGRALGLELNRVEQVDAACRFTFLAENRMGADLSAFTVETVIIDAEGVVDRLTLFEFGAMPDIRFTEEEVAKIRPIGDNTGCMALKGASKRHEISERPDEWPMRGELLELAGRYGLGGEW